ncbi:MAG: short-chain dehydrogenase, partial [Actinomycetes bacterium]
MPDTSAHTSSPHVIDPADLEVTLRVLASLGDVDEDDPDFTAVRNATAAMIKAVKQRRRKDRRAAIAAADSAVVAATATGAADRIDDETRGLTLEARVASPTAGT